MNTPILDFVRAYEKKGFARFHMPGHKGEPLLGAEPLDITEIAGADNLFAPDGIIAESEANATALFGSGKTLYSTEGSSLCIRAMLTLALKHAKRTHNGGRFRVLAARNAHKAFLYAVALLDLDVTWLYPEGATHLCEASIPPETVEKALEDGPFIAVYLTSPDYLGGCPDVGGIAAVCRRAGTPLLVDNAHGAYFAFSKRTRHPLALGATLCCDSAHKTLPVLTGGAYLHVAKDAPEDMLSGAREALALFASTSPSYLTLQSLDLCNKLLSGDLPLRLAETEKRMDALKTRAAALGFTVAKSDPLRLVLSAREKGLDGITLADVMRKEPFPIEVEMADSDVVVLLSSPYQKKEDFERLDAALTAASERFTALTPETVAKSGLNTLLLKREAPVAVMTPREALILSPHVTVPADKAVGRICAAPAVSCPPAIPIAVSGEVITPEAVALFRAYGITEISVVE